jgi:hypothetical protein
MSRPIREKVRGRGYHEQAHQGEGKEGGHHDQAHQGEGKEGWDIMTRPIREKVRRGGTS